MDFEWDEAKNQCNLEKHGVSFELAASFMWDRAVIQADNRRDYGEPRFIARGPAADGQGYHLAFTLHGSNAVSFPPAALVARIMSGMPHDKSEFADLPNNVEYGVPDEDTPELTEESLRRSIPAKQFFAERGLPIPGRPKSESPKVAVSLRLDQAVVEGFKAEGPGWQTRMNAVLADSLRQNKKSA